MRGGGGLVVLGECDQDKYGNNLQRAARPVRRRDRQHHRAGGRRRHQGVATWVLADLGATARPGRAGRCGRGLLLPRRRAVLDGAPDAQVLRGHHRRPPTRPASRWPPRCRPGRPGGRLRRLRPVRRRLASSELDHRTLWTNDVDLGRRRRHRAGRARGHRGVRRCRRRRADEHWLALKDAVDAASGRCSPRTARSTPATARPGRGAPAGRRDRPRASPTLAPRFPHDAAYLERSCRSTCARWADERLRRAGLPRLAAAPSSPPQHRVDGLQHLVVFPMYTQNGNPDRNLEAVVLRVVWPRLAGRAGAHPLRQPAVRADHLRATSPPATTPTRRCSSRRPSPCARRPSASPGAASSATARPPASAGSAPPPSTTLGLELPAGRRAAGRTTRSLAQEAFVLWDMIHDRTHSHGDLPFDPFMIKQREPFWMYAPGGAALRPHRLPGGRDAGGRGRARRAATCSTPSLFDRLFRFPVTGERVRNYDGLGGQLLFAYLHRHDVAALDRQHAAHRLGARCRRSSIELCAEIEKLYRDGIDRPKLGALVRGVRAGLHATSPPHPGSSWAKGTGRCRPGRAARKTGRRRAAGRVSAQHVLRGAAPRSCAT